MLSISFGNRSNHVATQFFNTLEQYQQEDAEAGDNVSQENHDVFFRQGEDSRGNATFLPRPVAGNIGAVPIVNDLYAPIDQSGFPSQQDAGFNVQESIQRRLSESRYTRELNEKGKCLTSPSEARYWSDFAHCYLHPRTIQSIPWHSDADSFQGWDNGDSAWQSYEQENSVLDGSLRLFVEELDSLAGFQVLTDVSDSFGAFSAGAMEDIRDEYSKASILTYGIAGGQRLQSRTFSESVSMAKASEWSDLYVPIAHCGDWNQAGHTINAALSIMQETSILAVHVESLAVPIRRSGNSKATDQFDDLRRLFCSERINPILLLSGGMDVIPSQRTGLQVADNLLRFHEGPHREDDLRAYQVERGFDFNSETLTTEGEVSFPRARFRYEAAGRLTSSFIGLSDVGTRPSLFPAQGFKSYSKLVSDYSIAQKLSRAAGRMSIKQPSASSLSDVERVELIERLTAVQEEYLSF